MRRRAPLPCGRSCRPRAAAALCLLALGVLGGCPKKTEVDLYVDGFSPERVSFEVEELGTLTDEDVRDVARRPDVDGELLLPPGACGATPCRSAIVTVFVRNTGEAEAPPVVRLKSPPTRIARQPIAFRGGEISKGRVGRIRWLVQLWPEEETLTATLSSSVFIVSDPGTPPRTPPPASATPAPGPVPTGASPTPPGDR